MVVNRFFYPRKTGILVGRRRRGRADFAPDARPVELDFAHQLLVYGADGVYGSE
jgi:hypothetical protein